ncbi:amidinotransferase, partial [Streptomyces sp. NPDC002788]
MAVLEPEVPTAAGQGVERPAATGEPAERIVPPVGSHTEWDPLEEIIVGRLEGATIPTDHAVVTCNVPPWAGRLQGLAAGFRYPRVLIERAQQEIDGFVALLESLGVTVRRPEA